MGFTSGIRQITRAVSDTTGLTQEEAELLLAAVALATALFGVLRAVDALMQLWPLPIPTSRAKG